MSYLQVELTVSGELAEPVSEVLARHAPGGVSVTENPTGQSDEAPVTVRAYLPMDERLETRRRGIEEGLWHLSQIQFIPEPAYQRVEEQNWSEAWKEHYRPIEVGERFLVQPAWIESSPTDRLVILMNPGMAFGTGTHPSTRLCLELLEATISPADTMVDLGCGSGILSVAGALLGAGRVLALDINPKAVEATKDNAARNGAQGIIEARTGSLNELLADRGPGSADVVAANILAPTLQEMLQTGLAEALITGGTLILGGILEDQAEEILAEAEGQGLRPEDERAQDDWRALRLTKRNPPLA